MLDKWTGEVVGTMHIYGVSGTELAKKMGITNRYLSQILNNKKNPKDGETRVRAALMELIDGNGENRAEGEAV